VTARIVVCRHGNTFNPGENVVMVGSQQDLPLTAVGEEQARAVGAALSAARVSPARILCAGLQRTRRYAELLRSGIPGSPPVTIDHRLTELDYGEWSGLSSTEIVARFGEQAWQRWQEYGERPSGVEFLPSAEQVQAETAAILSEAAVEGGFTVVVTSNGRARTFYQMGEQPHLDNGPTTPRLPGTLRTGHSGLLEHRIRPEHPGGSWQLVLWDTPPDRLLQGL
jgi:broad specificity phosphatase PhoE